MTMSMPLLQLVGGRAQADTRRRVATMAQVRWKETDELGGCLGVNVGERSTRRALSEVSHERQERLAVTIRLEDEIARGVLI